MSIYAVIPVILTTDSILYTKKIGEREQEKVILSAILFLRTTTTTTQRKQKDFFECGMTEERCRGVREK